jgi:CubicO group peptidase (beta-lactamase class C family)
MTEIHGYIAPRFAAVGDAFAANFANPAFADVGACFAATLNGETIVDIWAGHADEATTKPWERDTIINVYSTTKTMCALTALLLADRGELQFEQKVAHYWPEFAAAGKADVTVAMLMSHSAGLSGFREPMSPHDVYDWEKVTTLLAAQEPYWQPGTAPGYHAMTQGYLVGEVVRRITGVTLGRLFRDEIAGPVGADFHIGLPESEDHRCAELIPPPPGGSIGAVSTSELTQNMANNPAIDPRETRTRAWRAAEIPAANGHGNARSVAAVQTLLANGGVAGNGKRIFSEAGVRRALEKQISGLDLILNLPVVYGLGYGLPGGMMPFPTANAAFWGGYGGSLVVADLDNRLCMAYVMNRMAPTTTGDLRAGMICGATWQALLA